MRGAERTTERLRNELAELPHRIAELERSEAEYKRAEETYRAIAEQSLQGLIIIQDFSIVFANTAFAEISGYTVDELVSLSPDQARALIHPEDQALVWGRFQDRKEEKLVPPRYEYRCIRKDETVCWLEMVASRIEYRGKSAIHGTIADITRRKHAEKALRQSEEQYRNLFEQSRDAIYITTQEGEFLEVNQAFLDLFGYTREEISHLNAQETYANSDDRSRFQQEIEQKGSVRDFELILWTKDRTEIDCLVTATVWRADNGSILGYQGIIRDFSEHKQAEEALRASETEKRAILDAMSDIVLFHDTELSIRWGNEATGLSLDKTPQELVGGSCYKLWHGRSEPCQGCPVLVALETGVNARNIMTTPDGSRWEITGEPVKDTDGNVVGAIEIARDITRQKQADEALHREKEKFRILVEESPFGVSLLEKDGTYKYINPRFIEIFGYTLEDIPTGREWFKRAYPDQEYRNQVISTWISDLKEADPCEARPRTFTVTCKDDSEKVMLFRSVTMGTGDQFILYEDITETKRLEEQLQLAQKMEALGTLAGGIAHNFNNLLMGIIGNISLALFETDSVHPHYEKLKNVEKLVQSGSKLTKQLLGYAREGRYEIISLSLNRVVKETSATFGTTKKEITIHQELAEDLFPIEADQGQIEQALWNLYVNAADAMPGSGDLFLKTSNVTHKDMTGKLYKPKPGNYALLIVTDSGVGMDKKTMGHIFEPFFTTKGLGKGTGLGLASVYGIVKAHGGYIDVESEKGHGTSFKIYLRASDKKATKEKRAAPQILGGKETVLLVDDEDIVLDVGTQMLEKMGYKVLVAKSGKETIDIYKANKHKIDMVVLDMIMPEMSGGKTYDRIKQIDPNVKVLLSSGYSREGKATEILARGCNGFIQKPFNMKELSRRVREILDEP